MIFGEDPLVIWKISGQLPCDQQPLAHAEEQVIVIPGQNRLDFWVSIIGQLNQLRHGLLRNQGTELLVNLPAFGRRCLYEGQPMAIGGHHRQTLRPHYQKCTV